MRKLRRIALPFALSICSLGAAPASATPLWNLTMHHAPTDFHSGAVAEYWFALENVGPSPTSGTTTLTVQLPSGITRDKVIVQQTNNVESPDLTWSCPGSPGDATVTCTTSDPIPRHSVYRGLRLSVDVAPGASGEPVASTTLEGGGAPQAVSDTEPVQISSQPAPFGFVPGSFLPGFFAADGLTPVREAGAHPDLVTFPFDFTAVPLGAGVEQQMHNPETVRDLHVDTPPGFVGIPTAVTECSAADFALVNCPPSSQVGRLDLIGFPFASSEHQVFNQFHLGVFNLVHPKGTASDLAFSLGGSAVNVKVSLDPKNHYAIASEVPNVNETIPVFDQKLVLWGVPANHSHDSERCPEFSGNPGGDTSVECASGATEKPFISIPSNCEAEDTFRLHDYDSWQHPGIPNSNPEMDHTLAAKMTECERPRFQPEVQIEPTGKQANTPTGLDVDIHFPQNENPNGLATPPVKDTTVTLPRGMSFSPAFADGLQACSLAQIKLETNAPIACPDASRIGEVTLSTPLLPKPAEGSMYLAAQGDNPFESTFAVYLVLHDTEERGILIKIPGKIEVDETTGQITTVFNDTPQFPFEDLTLKFRSGPRAPLVSPPSCGEQTIGVKITSYAQPDKPIDASNTYQVTEGPNGTPCPPDPAHRPFAPSFSGGTLNPVSGSYSTFLFRLSREDQEQELSQVTTVLPPGLLAKIAGIPLCPEAQIAQAIGREGLGGGTLERDFPSCPAASQIGTVSAGVGAGPSPNYFSGKAYLAGPYKGAPLSLAIVVPGLAGPYDLGTTVVRAALHVDPETSRVTAVSDPFPTILHGVILRVRDVRLRLDRPETTLNPTNCEPMALNARISGTGGALFNAASPFQVGDCGRLGFKPALEFKLKGGTHRGDHPAFYSHLTARPGDANIASAVVALPHSEFLDQAHIGTVCTRVQFAADDCPPASIYGYAKAITPLLDQPVEGPLYLRSSNHLLPDLVAKLQGQISANLVGRVDSVHGGIRTTFESVPDVPVKEFTLTMEGGKKGLLVNSRNLCKAPAKADVRFGAQSGKSEHIRPLVQNSCGPRAQSRRHKRRG